MPPKAEPARLSRHYRWTPEDLRILRECQELDGRTATDTIRRALMAYLVKLKRDKENARITALHQEEDEYAVDRD